MNSEETIKKLESLVTEQAEKIEKIYVSVEKTRKYFFWTMIITIVVFVLPLIGLLFVIPSFLSNYTTNVQELGL